MNNIVALKAEIAAQAAEIQSLRDSLNGLRAYMQSSKFANEPYVNVTDIIMWAQQAASHASDEHSAAWINATGPSPVASRNGWVCPECGQPLQDSPIWNDTDARAAERMRLHWIELHQRKEA